MAVIQATEILKTIEDKALRKITAGTDILRPAQITYFDNKIAVRNIFWNCCSIISSRSVQLYSETPIEIQQLEL